MMSKKQNNNIGSRDEKLPYEKPMIVRHSLGLMNKFGRAPSSIPQGRIDGIPVRALVSQYGSPLYVVSEGTLRRKYKEIYRAFHTRYPRVAIGYSYKTNYLSAVCSILHQEGAWAEVVSGFEYDIALDVGAPGDKIIFNGPYKKREELERAVENGSMINIDSYDEMYMIEDIAVKRGKTIDIGVRINMQLNYPPWDRFGFNVETGMAYDAVKRAVSAGHLKLAGLHIHVGTFVTDLGIYKNMAEELSVFCEQLKRQLNIELKYLDIGGGYASSNTLHYQYMPAEQVSPSFDQYAEVICPALLRGPFDVKNVPLLILEPGRSIVDEAMYLVTSVVSSKRLSMGQKAIIVDAGVNLLPTAYWYRHDIISTSNGGNITEEVGIYGPLCMNIDVVRPQINLPPLRAGDVLIIKNVGAYNFSQSMQFIQPRPFVVLLNDGNVEVLREAETTQYIRQLEHLPDRLKKQPVSSRA